LRSVPRLGVLLILSLGGCASVACRPVSVVVIKKEVRARPESSPGLRTTETGRLEAPPLTMVRDYWIEAEDGSWHRVSAEQFEAAEVNGRLEICP
jgi:hypothetical protein